MLAALSVLLGSEFQVRTEFLPVLMTRFVLNDLSVMCTNLVNPTNTKQSVALLLWEPRQQARDRLH